MNKYKVEYRGKEYHYNGETCEDAMDKFMNRKVFGKDINYGYGVVQEDADTYGKEWARYEVNIGDGTGCHRLADVSKL